MGWKALKLSGLGALAAAALLAGCNKDDSGRQWAMTPQEDYYPDSHPSQTEPGFPRIDSTAFETVEHERGTGGAGQAAELGEEPARRDASAWASNFYSELVPGAETGFWHLTAPSQTGTGKELKAENGIWVQGTSSVEQCARASQLLK